MTYVPPPELAQTLLFNTLSECYQVGDDEIHFMTVGGRHYKLHHEQECCESVYIESIVGDLNDLVGTPLLLVAETINDEPPENADELDNEDSNTWTFYKFGTIKGYVDIRWHGSSNGYYSESVDFSEVSQ